MLYSLKCIICGVPLKGKLLKENERKKICLSTPLRICVCIHYVMACKILCVVDGIAIKILLINAILNFIIIGLSLSVNSLDFSRKFINTQTSFNSLGL